MGRKPKPLSERKTNLFNFTCYDMDLIEDIQRISQRECESFTDTVIKALEEYRIEHGKGNFQHTLSNYIEGAVLSNRQVEQRIMETLFDRDPVRLSDIYNLVKNELGYKDKKLHECARRLGVELQNKGKAVLQ